MNYDNDNHDEAFTAKRVNPRYIVVNEDIFATLEPDSLKTYMAFRYEADYSCECSSVKRTIEFLCNKTKLSRRQIFYCLNDLENNGLILRESNPGYQTIYWVAKDLNHFKTKEEPIPVQPVHGGVVHEVHGVVHEVHTIINNLSSNKNYSLSTIEQNLYIESEQQRKALLFRGECLGSQKCKDLYDQLPEDTRKDKSFQDIYEECLSHYATQQKPLLVSPQRLISWIKREISYWKKKDITDKKSTTPKYTFESVVRA